MWPSALKVQLLYCKYRGLEPFIYTQVGDTYTLATLMSLLHYIKVALTPRIDIWLNMPLLSLATSQAILDVYHRIESMPTIHLAHDLQGLNAKLTSRTLPKDYITPFGDMSSLVAKPITLLFMTMMNILDRDFYCSIVTKDNF
jgi:hypothetical protein